MKNILQRPHPFIFNRNSILIIFGIAFLVLLIFRPFGFIEFPFYELLGWSFLFSFISAICAFIVLRSLQQFVPEILHEARWTLGKEILLFIGVIICIMLVIFGFLLFLNPQYEIGNLINSVFFQTILISVFPIIVLVIYDQYHYQKIKKLEAQALNKELLRKRDKLHINKENESKKSLSQKILLKGENQKMVLNLKPIQLLYVKSEGNYLEAYYLQNQKVEKKLIRNSLKALKEQLPDKYFFRAHKSYLINLQHVFKVEGNARNLELILENVETRIPVSRSKSDALLQLISQ